MPVNHLHSPERICPPLAPQLARQLTAWWADIFQTSFDWLADPLAGGENRHTRSVLYLFRSSGRIAATCRLAHSLDDPQLGCLGEVAVDPQFRRQGLARILCRAAAAEFDRRQGRALFLASGNPAARRLYTDLGWRPVPGSGAMLRLSGSYEGLPLDQFPGKYFHCRPDLPVSVLRGGAACRIPMIPLILAPHRWRILDYNAGIYSTAWAPQNACEGLYGRYACLDTAGEAAWFAAIRADGMAVGLSSARRLEDGLFRVDGFAHASYEDICLEALYRRAVRWSRRQDGERICIPCAQNDRLKETALRRMPPDEHYEISFIPAS